MAKFKISYKNEDIDVEAFIIGYKSIDNIINTITEMIRYSIESNKPYTIISDNGAVLIGVDVLKSMVITIEKIKQDMTKFETIFRYNNVRLATLEGYLYEVSALNTVVVKGEEYTVIYKIDTVGNNKVVRMIVLDK